MKLFSVALGISLPIGFATASVDDVQKINFYQTSEQQRSDPLKRMPDLVFSEGNGKDIDNALKINPAVTYQIIEGFGAAMTESSAAILDQLPKDLYNQVMESYFSESSGLGYTFVRVPMGSCDYTPFPSWSYDDLRRGATDYDLEHFSIENDLERRIPHIIDAQERAGQKLKLLASPWSAPAWMKTNGAMICGVNR